MISIVIPVYKSEKTLGGCLESLMAQTYEDIEMICVIDGSPDRCGEICDEHNIIPGSLINASVSGR